MKNLAKKRKTEMKTYLTIYMIRNYSDYINITDEVENVEQVIRTDIRIKKCCYDSLELVRTAIYKT